MQQKKITIKGLVQGVGFRPAVYRIAHKYGINGTVENTNSGVIVIAESTEEHLQAFINALPDEIPEAAIISHLSVENKPVKGFVDFRIVASTSSSSEVTEISPDIAVCNDCLHDLNHQAHRLDYPLTNCTNCGPRFSIIRELPYDRPNTTMAPFVMCEICEKEYKDVNDRRFHAQPVACNHCGPKYKLITQEAEYNEIADITTKSAEIIDRGGIVALKSMGGYNLACDATHSTATERLRQMKFREGKPFALMVRDAETAAQLTHLSAIEKTLLTSWKRPVVLLKSKNLLPASIAKGLDTVGLMLPYMPFHYLLFGKLKTNVIVLTSGNLSDEPIITDDQTAMDAFLSLTDGVISYNRDIYNRVDDSVALVMNNKPRLIRRSRGYAPSPITTRLNTEGIFATGAELVNCFAVGKGNQVIMSQHIGDLKNAETLDFYQESIGRYNQLFRFTPQQVVTDLHPDYLSTKYALQTGLPYLQVQHHHAHMASCMAEHDLNEKVLGICLDGTGLGTDGNIWGGEFLYGDLVDFERFAHFEYIPQPGGDAVTKHPWRMMVAYLYHYFGAEFFVPHHPVTKEIDAGELQLLLSMLKNKINTPLTSSAGRLFDAVSAMLGLIHHSTYHAEAPMCLEAAADENETGRYAYSGTSVISFKNTFIGMLDDLNNRISPAVIAAKFHNTLIAIMIDVASSLRNTHGVNAVVLSGGSFQNRILLKKAEQGLKECNFAVFSHEKVPANDGGIALGQLAIAAARREQEIRLNKKQ